MNDDINDVFSEHLARTHYENFPVASFLLPKKARKDIYHVYTFARIADDIADSEDLSSEEKLKQLIKLESDLKSRNSENKLVNLIVPVIDRWHLNQRYFLDLLTAFKQDAVTSSYETFEDLINYSTYSANPVGRIILSFFDQHSENTINLSDKICTGLQLINFWQDLSRDRDMKRYYMPKSILKSHDLSLDDFYYGQPNKKHEMAIQDVLQLTQDIYMDGKSLIPRLKGRLKLEILFIWHSANRILKKSRKMGAELLDHRPKN